MYSFVSGRAWRALGCSLAILLTAASAAADRVESTRSELVVERAHEARVTLHRGHVQLVVERTVHNGGSRHDQTLFHLDLPPGAVATGLRTLGGEGGKKRWFAGELLEAELAAERYRELTGMGGYYPKDPALLSWRSQQQLLLQVFPCPPHANKTVEYTLEIPTEYADGLYRVSLPPLGTETLRARLELHPARKGDQVLVDGRAVKAGERVSMPGDRHLELALRPAAPALLEGALAVREFAPRRVLSHFVVAAAPRLSEVPVGAHLVVVIDASRSLGSHQVDAELAAARATLSHHPEARVEVITFDREAHERYGAFVPLEQALADLGSATIERENGSHIDLALARADQLLANAPADKARRVIVFTDARTRSSLTSERLAASFGASQALVHIAVLGGLSPRLQARFDDDWDRVVRPTGGLVWSAGANASSTEEQEMRATYEELARPLRLHRLRLTGDGLPDEALGAPSTLNEGQGLEDLRLTDLDVLSVRIEGELWAKPVRKVLVPEVAEGKLWSALVFGGSLLDELSEAEMMPLAMHGGAVSPVTSYLAIEPGVRPSTEGLDWGQGFGSGSGRLGGSHRVRMGATKVGNRFDAQAWLEAALRPGWDACGGEPDTASVGLETTGREVVDVSRVEVKDHNVVLERCLRQAVWDLDLPDAFRERWQSFFVLV